MKLVAHRGASVECQENTLESLILGAKTGADMVECDPRITKDGKLIIFHDNDLMRLAENPAKINTLFFNEIKEILNEKNLKLTSFDEIISGYHEKAPILLDFTTAKSKNIGPCLVCDDAFFAWLSKQNIPVVCGVHFVEEAVCASKYFPREQILAFIPDENSFERFYEAGAGIIRLWEDWLARVTPDDVHKKCPGVQVFIMSKRPGSGSDGTPEELDYLEKLNADGVLLNDIRMAVNHFRKNEV